MDFHNLFGFLIDFPYTTGNDRRVSLRCITSRWLDLFRRSGAYFGINMWSPWSHFGRIDVELQAWGRCDAYMRGLERVKKALTILMVPAHDQVDPSGGPVSIFDALVGFWLSQFSYTTRGQASVGFIFWFGRFSEVVFSLQRTPLIWVKAEKLAKW